MSEYDDWLAATYGNATPYDENSPAPDQFVAAPNTGVDADISAFVDRNSEAEANRQAAERGLSFIPGVGPSTPSPPVPGSSGAGTSSSISASTDTSGYNLSDAKVAAVKRASGDPLDARIAQSDAEMAAAAQATSADSHAATDQQKAVAARRAALDAEVADEKQKYAVQEAKLLSDQAFNERASQFIAEKKVEEALGNYQASVKAFEASNINPGKLWGDMSGGGKFATAISVFAANVLASKGINTTVMSSLNKAIDDNINAQLSNLDKKGKTAGMMKDVWSMVRQQSESDAEARQKLRGLMFSEFKAGVVSKLMAFDSDYARLKGQEVAAALDAEQVKNDGLLRQQLIENTQKARDFELRRQAEQDNLLMERQRNAIAAKEAETHRMATVEAIKPSGPALEKPETLVRDPYTGEVVGGTGDKTTASEVQKEWNAVSSGEKNINRLQELTNELGKIYDGPGRAAFLTKNKAELKSIYEELRFNEAVKLSGLTITDAQLKSLDNIYGGIEKWSKGVFGDMTTISTVGKKSLRDLDKVKTSLRTRVYKVNPETAAAYRGIQSESEGVVLPETRQTVATRPLPPDTDAMKHSAQFSDANSMRPIEPGQEGPNEVERWYEYTGVTDPSKVLGTGEIPRAFGAASSLYDLAEVGDEGATQALYELAKDGEVVLENGPHKVKFKASGEKQKIAMFFVKKLENLSTLPQSRPEPGLRLDRVGKPSYVDEYLQGQ